MKKLLQHYQAELALLRRYGRGFAERYPGLAGSLLLTDDTGRDPHVERMIQANALLAARISKRLDDGYPLFTESLLEMLYPHYLRTFPSSSIMQLDLQRTKTAQPDTVNIIPRGTVMKTASVRGVKCQFRSTSDIAIAPARIAMAHFHPRIQAPPGLRLPIDVSSCLSMTIDSVGRADLDIPVHRAIVA